MLEICISIFRDNILVSSCFISFHLLRNLSDFAVNHVCQSIGQTDHFNLLPYWSYFDYILGPDTLFVYFFVLLFVLF